MKQVDKEKLQAVVKEINKVSFVKGHVPSDEQALGIVLSKYFYYDGLSVLQAAFYALEDANFHTEAAVVAEMANKIEAKQAQIEIEFGFKEE